MMAVVQNFPFAAIMLYLAGGVTCCVLRPKASKWVCLALNILVTVLMYIGEMFLLNGHLYRFGRGLLFRGIPGMVLAPADILIIAAAGVITAVICVFINKKSNN